MATTLQILLINYYNVVKWIILCIYVLCVCIVTPFLALFNLLHMISQKLEAQLA